ncbi:hypothetical protein DCC85_21820 [Paenibacillus sp. CAA11]|uniref:hypothetical protein n=1 Tax=Paenibacillus sp. CAA11 TaxID=1532905 RepID=UPI000D39211D|nr:hypothetical protein [Paenibacillus sp. CAA11]AWB46545.1 hypothetical protein DCC85_21820 [Paenibacillus sp. CAA11]
MRYLKDTPFEDLGVWYFEVDDQGTAFRQVVIEESRGYVTSNRKHEQLHFLLADQRIDANQPYYTHITKHEFEEVWSGQLKQYEQEWQRAKEALPIGTAVEGYIEVFYPQGIIVHILTHPAVGVTDYAVCKEQTPPAWMYPRHKIKAMVRGYDEVNQWIVLEKASVLESQYLE